MKQTWNDLLFAHYPIKLEVLQTLAPDALPLDSFNVMGWIGVVPFHMTDIRLRGLPPIPGTNQFPELNVRTYVTLDGKPGVYFFSLDATNRLAVKVAKLLYYLLYKGADIMVKHNGAIIDYESRRRSDDGVTLVCNYRPISEPYHAAKGSFDEWMAERYCLYTLNNKGVPLRCDILHQPWLLQQQRQFSQTRSCPSKAFKLKTARLSYTFQKNRGSHVAFGSCLGLVKLFPHHITSRVTARSKKALP